MKSLKKTSFIEAVAAAIEHEVQCFNFYLKLSESLPEGQIRELFSQLALDGDEHIKYIKDIYKSAEGKELPNLKQLSEIEKFHSSTIQKIMDRLDRNKNAEVKADEKKAIELAIREGEDARNFYATIRGKFQDPKINLLFQKLANFNESNNSLLEAQAMAMEQSTPADQVFYWEDEDLLAQVNQPSKSQGKSKPSAKPKPASKAKVSAKPVAKPQNKVKAKKAVKKAAKPSPKKAKPKAKPAKKKGKKK
ncbi:rubrerythrin [Leptospira levettii]|uniref:ferritin-like domain-containing protein n=1 Tax=Leptospira levettii TaxID=2023178 RepID=UPI000C29AE4B|nr:ferritin family protein [Leptospira levettii]MCW7473225.1 ferritin family protein [Leptospira levettii]PJZ36284.1 rubrerythrin [Leptospira levettii]PJZ90017.1 rubrerythrin [Leptospira levettii]PJZ99038.1 rubrerythrin [Leptospira levettii]TGL17940.1 rubrerythrin [Leptospira levettii]